MISCFLKVLFLNNNHERNMYLRGIYIYLCTFSHFSLCQNGCCAILLDCAVDRTVAARLSHGKKNKILFNLTVKKQTHKI